MKRILLIHVVIVVLLVAACGSSKSGEADTPAATEGVQVESGEVLLETTYTPPPTDTPTPAETATVEVTVSAEATATGTPQEPTAEIPAPTATMTPTAPPAPPEITPQRPTPTMSVSQASAGQAVELTRIEDTDPGPPLAILVSAIRIKENGYYKLTGKIRNDGSEIYGGIGVMATFFTDVQPPNWHSLGKVYAACQLLEPGAECPFSLEIYPRDYVSYHLHPDGTPVEHRQSASLVLSNLNVHNDVPGYVRITGTATNENPFVVRDANIAGTLIDAAGQITSVGMILVPGEIAPGAGVSFDLRIEQAPYAHYELQAQATQN